MLKRITNSKMQSKIILKIYSPVGQNPFITIINRRIPKLHSHIKAENEEREIKPCTKPGT